MRIELTPQAWEAHVLPLNYTRVAADPQGNSATRRLATQKFSNPSAAAPESLRRPKKTKKNLAEPVDMLFSALQKTRA
jgi:hypothetical protein